MYMKKTFFLLLCFLELAVVHLHAQSPICGAATEFCAENNISFPASTNAGNPSPGNNYGCLNSQPNPAWFYMSTTGAGSAIINLQSSPAQDIDFALWGPFTSLSDALSNCGSLGSPISCSFDPASNETASLNSGGPGEFFLMLITNFSNQPTQVSGTTTSSILSCNACLAEGGSLNPGNQAGCFSTLQNIDVDFGSFTPSPIEYGYTLVVTDPVTGTITQEFVGTTLSPTLLGPGTFRVCGISYEFVSGPATFVGQNYNSIQSDLGSANPSFCGDLSDNCVDIIIRPDPTPSFIVDSVCVGASAPNCPFINNAYICDPGAGSFTVQTAFGCDSLVSYLITPRGSVIEVDSVQVCPGEPFNFNGVDYFAPGPAVINIPASSTGCDTTLFLLIQEEPLFAFVTPPSFNLDCLNPTVDLNSTGSSTGPNITQVWLGPTGIVGTGPVITVSDPGTYTFTVVRTDPRTGETCTAMATAVITESPPETGQPTVDGPSSLCVGENGVYTYSYAGPNGPYTFTYEIRNVPATVVTDIPGSLTLSFTAGGTAEVCFTASGACGPTPETCVTTQIEAPVVADAGPDTSFCALTGNVTGNPSGGTWTALPGPDGTGLITNPSQANSNVSVGSPGTYAFEYAFNGNCPSADTVLITFADPVMVINVDEICNNATLDYTVTFEITGGTPPYTTVGTSGTLSGNLFTSDPITSGDSYSIVVLDVNGCTATLQGSFTCSCTTDAGDMPSSLIEVCVPDSLQASLVSNEVPDGDDVGTYVLHTSPTDVLGTVLQTNSSRWFFFQGPIVVDVTYYVSYIIGTDNGNGNPDPNDPCFDVSIGQPVIWRSSDPVNAGPDETICGLSATLDATGIPGLWTVPGGTSVSSNSDPRATFTGPAGTYILTWSSDGALCPSSDQVEITLTEPMDAVNIDEICGSTNADYVLTFEITGGTPPFISVGATGSIAGNIFTSDPIASGDSYSTVILDANGCSTTVQGSHTCNCTTNAGNMPTDLLEACIPSDIQAGLVANEILDGDDIGTYVLHDSPSGTLGTVFQTSATSLFSFQPPLVVDVTYYVSYILGSDNGTGNPDPNDPCFDVSVGQPIVWRDIPILSAGPDDALCGLMTTLQASGSPGLWTVPTGTTVSSMSDPNATFSATTHGTYVLTWSSDGAFCPTVDTVEITFNEDPQATNAFACDSGDPLAVVTITASGGQAPYTLVGLPPSGPGPIYTLNLPAGIPYSFSIVDANGCSSITYTNTPNCDCETEAPTLAGGASQCIGEPVQLSAATGGLNDGNDATVYILYEGSATNVANILATSSSPSFPYDVRYIAGTTYYIAAVRGNDNGNGGVDPADPCLDTSLGVPVIWNDLPTISLSDAITCEGDTARVAYQYVGSLPAEIDLVIGGVARTVVITSSSGEFNFFGEQGILSVSSLRENPGCENDGVTNTANVTIQTIQAPILEPDFSLCNSDVTSDPFEQDLSALVISGGGGTWSSPDAPGALTGTIFSGLGLATGRYLLVYETAAVASCPSQRAEVSVTIRDCTCPNLTLLSPGVLCNNDARILLDNLLQESQVGDWSLTSVPSGTQPGIISAGFFDATSADAGTYRLLFTLTQGNVAGCPDTASLAITVARQPLAGFSTGSLSFCEGDSDIVDLASLLTGQDSGGDWVSLSGGPAPVNGTVDISTLTTGDYTFEYTVSAPAPCDFARSEIQISINEGPQVDAGADITLNCTFRIADLGTAASPGVDYIWSNATTGELLDSSATYQTDLSGLYELTATNPANGCSSSDLVEVVVSNDVPEVFISLQPISCANEMDASARIDSIAGGVGPYIVSFNGSRTNERVWNELGAGAYQIEVEDANGCSADAFVFDIIQPQVFDVFLDATMSSNGGSGEIRLGDTVFLSVTTTGDTSAIVQWTPAEYVACDTCANTFGIPPASLTYAVSLVSGNGCTADDFIQVFVRDERVVFFPTGFSPNGDNVNDFFFPQAPEGLVNKVNSFIILDRWGEIVYSQSDFDVNVRTLGWDGTLKGEEMNPQVFVFLAEIEYFDGRTEQFEGDFSLIR